MRKIKKKEINKKLKEIKNYEIDQSGKIEKTSKDTILCLSNGKWDAVIIKAKTKRQIQEIFRRNGQIRNYILFTFSTILSILLRRNKELGQVMVDTEYFGKDAIIKNIVLEILSDITQIPDIHFGFVGKLSLLTIRQAKLPIKRLRQNTKSKLKRC